MEKANQKLVLHSTKKITTLGVCNKILGFSVILIRAKRIAEGVRHEKKRKD